MFFKYQSYFLISLVSYIIMQNDYNKKLYPHINLLKNSLKIHF